MDSEQSAHVWHAQSKVDAIRSLICYKKPSFGEFFIRMPEKFRVNTSQFRSILSNLASTPNQLSFKKIQGVTLGE